MSDQLTEVQEAPPVEQATPEQAGLPAVSDELRAAFANARNGESPPEPQPAPGNVQPAAKEAPAETPQTADYSAFVKELGYESPEALKAHVEATKGYKPDEVERWKANQRDEHDTAVRALLAEPEKAEAYFALQRLRPDEMATGTADQQRQLLFEKFKLDNPHFTGRLAEIEFEDEYENKYAPADSDDAHDPAVERAKVRRDAALKSAAPAVKQAQEAAKIALLPEKANGPTAEQQAAEKAYDDDWLAAVEGLGKDPVQQKFQSEFGDVTVAFDASAPDAKSFLDDPVAWLKGHVGKLAFPEGYKPGTKPNLGPLLQIYGAITQPDAVVKAAAAVGKASVGAHVPMDRITNPAPQAPLSAGEDGGEPNKAAVAAAIRGVVRRN